MAAGKRTASVDCCLIYIPVHNKPAVFHTHSGSFSLHLKQKPLLHLPAHNPVFISQPIVRAFAEISLHKTKHLIFIQILHTDITFIFFIVFIIHAAFTIRDLSFSAFHKLTFPAHPAYHTIQENSSCIICFNC